MRRSNFGLRGKRVTVVTGRTGVRGRGRKRTREWPGLLSTEGTVRRSLIQVGAGQGHVAATMRTKKKRVPSRPGRRLWSGRGWTAAVDVFKLVRLTTSGVNRRPLCPTTPNSTECFGGVAWPRATRCGRLGRFAHVSGKTSRPGMTGGRAERIRVTDEAALP